MLDEERAARIGAMTEQARPVWETARDADALQKYLKDRDCNGAEAIFVTMRLLGCDLREAQHAYFRAPCRDADRRFHNSALEELARANDDGEL